DGMAVGQTPPVSKFVIDQSRRRTVCAAIQDLLGLRRAFEPLRSKRGYIHGIVIKRGERKSPVGTVEPAWGVVTEQSSLPQASNVGFEAYSVVSATKIKPSDPE